VVLPGSAALAGLIKTHCRPESHAHPAFSFSFPPFSPNKFAVNYLAGLSSLMNISADIPRFTLFLRLMCS
jgi:hypothetical protein